MKKVEFNPDDLIEESHQQQANDLIDMVTGKSAWSEEDKTMVEDIIEAIDTQYAVTDYNEMVNWLKSLKDRYTWKPSDEQMEALANACDGKILNLDYLNSLYQDLKKLKGE